MAPAVESRSRVDPPGLCPGRRRHGNRGKASGLVATFLVTTMWRNADLYNVTLQGADAKKIAAELLGGVDTA